jgi:hypothetical protein
MPYTIRKVKGKDCYTVKNTDTKVVHAKCSTKEDAEAQVRLLERLRLDLAEDIETKAKMRRITAKR